MARGVVIGLLVALLAGPAAANDALYEGLRNRDALQRSQDRLERSALDRRIDRVERGQRLERRIEGLQRQRRERTISPGQRLRLRQPMR